MFSTIEAAIDYIQGKIADFYWRQGEITTLYQQARVNLQDAYAQNKFIDEAKESLSEAIQLVDEYWTLAEKLRPLANAFNVNTGLAAFPVAVTTAIYFAGGITAVIITAQLLYAFYQRLQIQAVKIDQVKRGLLPAEALDQGGIFQDLGGLLSSATGLLLVSGAALFLWRAK